MSERLTPIVGFTGDASGNRRLDAAVREALAAADQAVADAFLDYPAVGDALRAARFRSQLEGGARAALHRLETAAGLVIGIPTERGSIPGQFKHVFDLADPERLAGKPCLVLVHQHGADDAAAVRRQAEFLAESFGLVLAADVLPVDRRQFASDGRLNDDATRLIARAGRMLAVAAALAQGVPPVADERRDRRDRTAARPTLVR